MKNKIIFSSSMGLILNWVSLILSYREVQNLKNVYDISTPMAIGGFPFKTFEYPVPPLGGDWPPVDAWLMFFLNLVSWILVGLLVSLMLGNRLKNKKVIKIIGVLAIFSSILGMLYIMVKFD